MATEKTWGAAFAGASTDAMEVYDRVLVPRMFEPWADVLLDEVAVVGGEDVLDVAAGPGSVARLAGARVGASGRVTACDISPAMLGIARDKALLPGSGPVEYVECPADALAVPDAAFDVVVCQQGLQFFPDRPAAVAEMRRAARPGARVGIAVWCAIETCPPFAALEAGLGKVMGPEVALAYRSGPWGLGDAGELGGLVETGGFSDVRVTRHDLPVEFDGGVPQLVETLAAAGVASQVAELDDAGHQDLLRAVEAALGAALEGGVVRTSLASHIAVGTAG